MQRESGAGHHKQNYSMLNLQSNFENQVSELEKMVPPEHLLNAKPKTGEGSRRQRMNMKNNAHKSLTMLSQFDVADASTVIDQNLQMRTELSPTNNPKQHAMSSVFSRQGVNISNIYGGLSEEQASSPSKQNRAGSSRGLKQTKSDIQ